MLAYLFVIFAVIFRLLPHTFHFTPVGASLLYFGARRSRKELFIPVVLMAASDVYLTIFHYGYRFTADNLITFAWYAGAVLIGSLLRENRSAVRVVGASLAASLSFFAVSNFAVWAFYALYPHTLAGLAACYVAAIPFFRNTLASDLIFSAVFFGTPALAAAMYRRLAISGGSEAAA